MDTQLYLRVRGRILGPYDQEKLQSLVRRGQLSRMHEVSTDGVQWVSASSYAELFVAVPVRLVAPEMHVAAPPATEQAANEYAMSFAEETGSAAPATTGRGWRYENLGAEHGPVDEAVLRQMLMTGQLGSEALVWTDGMPQWAPASQVHSLAQAAFSSRGPHGGDHPRASDEDLRRLCKAAAVSHPWAMFVAITVFVYAGLSVLLGLWMLIRGAESGVPPLIAVGLFEMIGGGVTATGGILLSNYANRLASLAYGNSCKVLESALERLKTFWVFVSIVLIVNLAFIGFFVIWIFAIGVSLARFM